MNNESPIEEAGFEEYDLENHYYNFDSIMNPKKSQLILDNKYKILYIITKNSSNKILLCLDLVNNSKYAIKLIKSKNLTFGLSLMDRQATYMDKCRGEYVIDLVEFKVNGKKSKSKYPNGKTCHYLVLEYAPRGELFNFIKLNNGIYHKIARYYFKQLINGVESLHKLNTCHRDIKIDNLLLDENFNLKISDFEFCQDIKGKDDQYIYHEDKLGTLSYMAPEFFSPRMHPENKLRIFHTGDKVDIFACGVVLFTLLTGFFPFTTAEKYDNNFKLFYEGKHDTFWKGKKIRHALVNIPESAKDLINRMLEPNPDKRITISDIKAHAFFNEAVPDSNEVYDYMNNIWLMLERKFRKKEIY